MDKKAQTGIAVIIIISILIVVLVLIFSNSPKQPSQCSTNWECSSWSQCTNGKQTRACTDKNNCSNIINVPFLMQNCTSTIINPPIINNTINNTTNNTAVNNTINNTPICVSNWSCTEWSYCAYSQRSRDCTDLNNCNLGGMPIIIERCTNPFETNANYGYENYKSGTWIKIDGNSDGILEQYSYVGSITAGPCMGLSVTYTSEGYLVNLNLGEVYICNPSGNGYKRYR